MIPVEVSFGGQTVVVASLNLGADLDVEFPRCVREALENFRPNWADAPGWQDWMDPRGRRVPENTRRGLAIAAVLLAVGNAYDPSPGLAFELVQRHLSHLGGWVPCPQCHGEGCESDGWSGTILSDEWPDKGPRVLESVQWRRIPVADETTVPLADETPADTNPF